MYPGECTKDLHIAQETVWKTSCLKCM